MENFNIEILEQVNLKETFKEIRKIVVNSNSVGKLDMLNASLENKALNNTISEIEIFKANKTSKRIDGIGIIKKIIAASKYIPNTKSDFFIFLSSYPFVLIFYSYTKLHACHYTV